MNAELLEQWNKIKAKYDVLMRRERILVAVGLVLGPALLVNALLLEPATNKAKAVRQSLRQADLTRNDLVNQLVALQGAMQNSPDVALKAELQKISEGTADANERLSNLRKSLVSPAEMSGMLEQLLARHPGLRLVGLRTLPVESLLPKASAAELAAAETQKTAELKNVGSRLVVPVFDLFRHGVEIKLEGGFVDLHAYLAQLERQEKRLLWGSVHFEVLEHPKSRMTLLIHTLSTDKAWLSL